MKELEKLKKAMIDSHKELDSFKTKNSQITGNYFKELRITPENYQEYDRLLKNVSNSIANFKAEKVNCSYIDIIKKCKFISKKILGSLILKNVN